jgi:hypothetical protein
VRSYEVATPADDTSLRALLRENAMPSWVTMTTERDPSWFAGCNRFGKDWAVLARDGGEIIGMYSCATHRIHLNGRAVDAGYLGALRVRPEYRRRMRILREGYASIPRNCRAGAPPFWYTAIAGDNGPARRILEANLPGMPRYRHCNDMSTLAFPRARGVRRNLWQPMQLAAHAAARSFGSLRLSQSPQRPPSVRAGTESASHAGHRRELSCLPPRR